MTTQPQGERDNVQEILRGGGSIRDLLKEVISLRTQLAEKGKAVFDLMSIVVDKNNKIASLQSDLAKAMGALEFYSEGYEGDEGKVAKLCLASLTDRGK